MYPGLGRAAYEEEKDFNIYRPAGQAWRLRCAVPQEPAAAGDRHPRTPDVHIRIDTQLICRETLAEQQKEAEAP